MSSQTPADSSSWRALFSRERLPALAILSGGVLMQSMSVLMLATVMPSIVGEMGGATMMAWPTTAYMASSIIASTCTGLFTANWGARATFILGAVVFGLGALACALAPSIAWVVGGRFVQGLGGGMLTAVPYVVIRLSLPEPQWGRAIGLVTSMWTISIMVGPMAGGAFARFGSWRWAFLAVTALAAVLALVALRLLPKVRAGESAPQRHRIPGLRVSLIATAIAILSSAAVVTQPAGKAALIAVSIATLVFTLWLDRRASGGRASDGRASEGRATRSLLPSDSFSWRTPTGTGLWLTLLLAIAYSPLSIYVPIFLQRLHGLDPLASGYALAGASMGWTLAALAVAGAAAAWQSRYLIAGPLLMVAGLAGVAALTAEGHLAVLCIAITLVGVGIGLPWSFMAERVMRGARKGEEAIVATSVSTVQLMGFAMGGALAGLAANSAGLTPALAKDGLVNASFWTPLVFVVPALVAVIAAVRLIGVTRLRPEPLPGRS